MTGLALRLSGERTGGVKEGRIQGRLLDIHNCYKTYRRIETIRETSFRGERDFEKPNVPLTKHLQCLDLEWTIKAGSIILGVFIPGNKLDSCNLVPIWGSA